jgi:predicted outer membrane repeat protein
MRIATKAADVMLLAENSAAGMISGGAIRLTTT